MHIHSEASSPVHATTISASSCVLCGPTVVDYPFSLLLLTKILLLIVEPHCDRLPIFFINVFSAQPSSWWLFLLRQHHVGVYRQSSKVAGAYMEGPLIRNSQPMFQWSRWQQPLDKTKNTLAHCGGKQSYIVNTIALTYLHSSRIHVNTS